MHPGRGERPRRGQGVKPGVKPRDEVNHHSMHPGRGAGKRTMKRAVHQNIPAPHPGCTGYLYSQTRNPGSTDPGLNTLTPSGVTAPEGPGRIDGMKGPGGAGEYNPGWNPGTTQPKTTCTPDGVQENERGRRTGFFQPLELFPTVFPIIGTFSHRFSNHWKLFQNPFNAKSTRRCSCTLIRFITL